ncbi:UNKNOWN [Stylonychia lemnae]|uniref:Uncharacterized protein n=1 Tax=Stylonychia lemnae TaxID=5949 RepID=A0A078B3D7_STYLE|nr:UNKNOWN [Stylonychia lemnae]|eukprot:CDW88018.1 UNKNOWN [Stylonychia lemnae]
MQPFDTDQVEIQSDALCFFENISGSNSQVNSQKNNSSGYDNAYNIRTTNIAVDEYHLFQNNLRQQQHQHQLNHKNTKKIVINPAVIGIDESHADQIGQRASNSIPNIKINKAVIKHQDKQDIKDRYSERNDDDQKEIWPQFEDQTCSIKKSNERRKYKTNEGLNNNTQGLNDQMNSLKHDDSNLYTTININIEDKYPLSHQTMNHTDTTFVDQDSTPFNENDRIMSQEIQIHQKQYLLRPQTHHQTLQNQSFSDNESGVNNEVQTQYDQRIPHQIHLQNEDIHIQSMEISILNDQQQNRSNYQSDNRSNSSNQNQINNNQTYQHHQHQNENQITNNSISVIRSSQRKISHTDMSSKLPQRIEQRRINTQEKQSRNKLINQTQSMKQRAMMSQKNPQIYNQNIDGEYAGRAGSQQSRTINTDKGYIVSGGRHVSTAVSSQIKQRNNITSEQSTKNKIKQLIEKRKINLFAEENQRSMLEFNPDVQISKQYEMNNQLYTQYKNQQLNNVKQIKIADYYNNNKGDNSVRGKTFKEMMLRSLMYRKDKNSHRQSTSPYHDNLQTNQSILDTKRSQEEEQVDKMLNTTDIMNFNLQNQNNVMQKQGVLDIDKMYQKIINKLAEEKKDAKLPINPMNDLLTSNNNTAHDNGVDQQLEADAVDLSRLNESLFDDQSSMYDNSFRGQQSILKSRLQKRLNLSKQIVSESIKEENGIYQTGDESAKNHINSIRFQESENVDEKQSKTIMDHYYQISKIYQNNQEFVKMKRQFQQQSYDRPFSFSHQRDINKLKDKRKSSDEQNNNLTGSLAERNIKNDNSINITLDQNVPKMKGTHARQSYSQNNSLPRFNYKHRNNYMFNHQDSDSKSIQNNYTNPEDLGSGVENSHREKDLRKQKYDKNLQNNIDWNDCLLKKYIDTPNQHELQYINDNSLYSNEDIDYMINMVRLNEKAFERSNTLSQIHNKTLNTIQKLCSDIQLDKVAIKIQFFYADRDSKTLQKLLLRCKEFFVIRVRIIKILKLISEREAFMTSLKDIIRNFNEQDENDLSYKNSDKSVQLRQLNYNINVVSEELVKLILSFLCEYHKYFGKNYLEVARREAKEIAEVLLIIKGD